MISVCWVIESHNILSLNKPYMTVTRPFSDIEISQPLAFWELCLQLLYCLDNHNCQMQLFKPCLKLYLRPTFFLLTQHSRHQPIWFGLLILITLKTKITNSTKKDCHIESSSLTNHNLCHMSLAHKSSCCLGHFILCQKCFGHCTLGRGTRSCFQNE